MKTMTGVDTNQVRNKCASCGTTLNTDFIVGINLFLCDDDFNLLANGQITEAELIKRANFRKPV